MTLSNKKLALENRPENLIIALVSNAITTKRCCFIRTFRIILIPVHCERMAHWVRSSNFKSVRCTIAQTTVIFVWYTYQWKNWNAIWNKKIVKRIRQPWFVLRVRQTFLNSSFASGALLFKSINWISTTSLNEISPMCATISRGYKSRLLPKMLFSLFGWFDDI